MFVRNHLLPPSKCDNCEGLNITLTTNAVVYKKDYGKWPYCYYCNDCGAMVGCHANTHSPLGLMATGATRRQRGILHALFDPIWHNQYLSRDDAYKWLGKELGITQECHISQLTKDQLKQAIELLRAHNKNDYAQFHRRKTKNDSRSFARARRQDNKIEFRKSKYQP